MYTPDAKGLRSIQAHAENAQLAQLQEEAALAVTLRTDLLTIKEEMLQLQQQSVDDADAAQRSELVIAALRTRNQKLKGKYEEAKLGEEEAATLAEDLEMQLRTQEFQFAHDKMPFMFRLDGLQGLQLQGASDQVAAAYLQLERAAAAESVAQARASEFSEQKEILREDLLGHKQSLNLSGGRGSPQCKRLREQNVALIHQMHQGLALKDIKIVAAARRAGNAEGGALWQADEQRANGNLQQAYTMYRKILDGDSGNTEALRGVVLCLLETGHGSTAIEAAKRLQALKSSDAEANLLLAEAMLAAGRVPESLNAVPSQPHLRSRLMMAQAKVALIEEDFKKALSLASEAVRMETGEGGDVKALLLLAEVRIQFADYAGALGDVIDKDDKEGIAQMGQFSLPIHVSCVRSTIRSKDGADCASTPTISIGLNLDIPIGDLLQVLMTYQQTPEANMPTPNFKGLSPLVSRCHGHAK
eukprot:g22910.t1